MIRDQSSCRPALLPGLLRLLLAARIFLSGGLGVGPQDAALAAGGGTNVIRVIIEDHGGLLEARQQEVRAIEAAQQRVELKGTCLSACTMYLSLSRVCLHPGALLGFHGPSRYGRPLSDAVFEEMSQLMAAHLMAAHYREPLRSWFMTTARFRIHGYRTLTGAELIRMGYPACN